MTYSSIKNSLEILLRKRFKDFSLKKIDSVFNEIGYSTKINNEALG